LPDKAFKDALSKLIDVSPPDHSNGTESWEEDVSLDRKDFGIYVLFILELVVCSSERD